MNLSIGEVIVPIQSQDNISLDPIDNVRLEMGYYLVDIYDYYGL
jgi:hypothetical protein